ncbi:thioredoxin-disulfide reductase [compost metagenome]
MKTENGIEIITDNNDKFTAKKIIFATGIKDIMPAIAGFSACWGISIVHCPYCHGYENRNKNTAIIANGAKAFHLVSLVSRLTGKLTVLTSGKADFSAEQLEKLNAHHIRIIETPVAEVEHKNGHIQNIVFSDQTKESFDVAYSAIPFIQHSNLPVSLGCELNEHGYLKIDTLHKTTVPNIYACGDNSNRMRSVANAVYSGNMAGALVNAALAEEEF